MSGTAIRDQHGATTDMVTSVVGLEFSSNNYRPRPPFVRTIMSTRIAAVYGQLPGRTSL